MRRGPSLLVPILIVLLLGHVCRVASLLSSSNSATSEGVAVDQLEWLVRDMAKEEEEDEFLMDSEINTRMLQGSSNPNYYVVKSTYCNDLAIACGHKGQEPCFRTKKPPGINQIVTFTSMIAICWVPE